MRAVYASMYAFQFFCYALSPAGLSESIKKFDRETSLKVRCEEDKEGVECNWFLHCKELMLQYTGKNLYTSETMNLQSTVLQLF